MAKTIHYHTDCIFFAGCENMLVNFWSSPELRSQFDISFSYRATERYSEGLKRRAQIDFPVYPMRFLDLSDPAIVPGPWPLLAKRMVLLFLRLALTVPLLCYDVWALRRLFLRVRPDLVHINNGGYPAALSARSAAIAARLAGVQGVVMVVNNQAIAYSRPFRWLDYPIDLLVVQAVSRFVTASALAARQLSNILHLNEAQCVALHNGIAVRQTTETREETRKRLGLENFQGVIFGVVAVLRLNKGHQVLLGAMAKLLGTSPNSAFNIKVLIEGVGPLSKDLKAFVADNRLSDHCIFIGVEENVMNFMALLDVLILPSIDYEDFPNVILEAMGMGKPVIASRLAGIPEQIVDGETGILVEPRDVDQLAAAMARLAMDKDLRVQMGQAGRRRFQEHFTSKVAVNNYVSLYQSLMNT